MYVGREVVLFPLVVFVLMLKIKIVSVGHHFIVSTWQVVLGSPTLTVFSSCQQLCDEVAGGYWPLLRFRKSKRLAQVHPASKWQGLLLNPVLNYKDMVMHCLPVGWFVDFIVIIYCGKE